MVNTLAWHIELEHSEVLQRAWLSTLSIGPSQSLRACPQKCSTQKSKVDRALVCATSRALSGGGIAFAMVGGVHSNCKCSWLGPTRKAQIYRYQSNSKQKTSASIEKKVTIPMRCVSRKLFKALSCTRFGGRFAERCKNLIEHTLGIAKQHSIVGLVEQGIIHSRITRCHTAFEHNRSAGFPDF